MYEIGKKRILLHLNNYFHPQRREQNGSIMRQGFSALGMIDAITEEASRALMKTFTIAEKTLKG